MPMAATPSSHQTTARGPTLGHTGAHCGMSAQKFFDFWPDILVQSIFLCCTGLARPANHVVDTRAAFFLFTAEPESDNMTKHFVRNVDSKMRTSHLQADLMTRSTKGTLIDETFASNVQVFTSFFHEVETAEI
eukprot:m.39694 g.39694  ORF g.39694 m.39694 type:complete len:133 (+) comp5957_c0_seq1:55-453(+)